MARDERNCLARHRDLFRLPLQRAFALRLDERASGTLSCFPDLGEKILLSILVEYELAFGLPHSCFNMHRAEGHYGAAVLVGDDQRLADTGKRPTDEILTCRECLSTDTEFEWDVNTAAAP